MNQERPYRVFKLTSTGWLYIETLYAPCGEVAERLAVRLYGGGRYDVRLDERTLATAHDGSEVDQ